MINHGWAIYKIRNHKRVGFADKETVQKEQGTLIEMAITKDEYVRKI